MVVGYHHATDQGNLRLMGQQPHLGRYFADPTHHSSRGRFSGVYPTATSGAGALFHRTRAPRREHVRIRGGWVTGLLLLDFQAGARRVDRPWGSSAAGARGPPYSLRGAGDRLLLDAQHAVEIDQHRADILKHCPYDRRSLNVVGSRDDDQLLGRGSYRRACSVPGRASWSWRQARSAGGAGG